MEANDNEFLGTGRLEGDKTDGGGHSLGSSKEIVIGRQQWWMWPENNRNEC